MVPPPAYGGKQAWPGDDEVLKHHDVVGMGQPVMSLDQVWTAFPTFMTYSRKENFFGSPQLVKPHNTSL